MKFFQFLHKRRLQRRTHNHMHSVSAKPSCGGDATIVTSGDETSDSNESRDDYNNNNNSTTEQTTTTTTKAPLRRQQQQQLPVWRAENFLPYGPMNDADWWDNDDDDDDDDDGDVDDKNDSCCSSVGSCTSDHDDDDDDDEDSMTLTEIEAELRYNGGAAIVDHTTTTSSQRRINKSNKNSTTTTTMSATQQQQRGCGGGGSGPYHGKRFTNRGYETWSRTRHAWITSSSCDDTNNNEIIKRAPPIPASFRKELVKCLADRRHFELSHSIALSCVIDAYQQVWQQDGGMD